MRETEPQTTGEVPASLQPPDPRIHTLMAQLKTVLTEHADILQGTVVALDMGGHIATLFKGRTYTLYPPLVAAEMKARNLDLKDRYDFFADLVCEIGLAEKVPLVLFLGGQTGDTPETTGPSLIARTVENPLPLLMSALAQVTLGSGESSEEETEPEQASQASGPPDGPSGSGA